MPLSRRRVLGILGAGSLLVYLRPWSALYGCAPAGSRHGPAESPRAADANPIRRDLPDVAPEMFFGDPDPTRAHGVLWNPEAFRRRPEGRIPPVAEHVPLVVVGGGMSGLATAYLLREHAPVVLEYSGRFGGNAQGQSWRGIDYSIGAAYFIEPEADGAIASLLGELGVDREWRIQAGGEPFELDGALHADFWSGGPDAHGHPQFARLARYFRAVNEGEEIPFPDIPILDPAQADYVKELDRVPFHDHVEKMAGGPLHPRIEAAIEHYCWSSLGAGSAEVSAAAGLNFYAAEFGNVAVMPGGNAAVAQRFVERLAAGTPPASLRGGCLVTDVRVVDDGVVVAYLDATGLLRSIHARAVALCCPKRVVPRILHAIEPDRVAAISRLRYRGYLVANVLLEGGPDRDFYDLYLLGDGRTDVRAIPASAREQGATDVVLADYARPDPDHTVLTIYRAFPYEGVRSDWLAPGAWQRSRDAFHAQVMDSILPVLGLSGARVVDLRVARWGHALPVAAPGLIADGTVDVLRRPFGERVFFVEQDNWALPAFETCLTEAIHTAPRLSRALA